MRLLAVLALCLAAQPVLAESYRFKWVGANGYRIEGAMAISPAALGQRRIGGDDLSCFVIRGFAGPVPLGIWRLGWLTPETDWNFNFYPEERAFGVGGMHDGRRGQAWNMDGWGTSCGPGGFGFNSGTGAQDICVDGALIVASQVPPPTPFGAVPDETVEFEPEDCRPPDAISELGTRSVEGG
ncbi:MAG: hypothetical protein AAFW69_00960 [Pseudomonadota bacterium]